jgi:hypothetical protein
MTTSQKTNRKYLIWFLIGVLFALLPWLVLAQSNPIKKGKFNINKQEEDAIGHTQAVKIGKTLYISGSVAGGDMNQAVKNVLR